MGLAKGSREGSARGIGKTDNGVAGEGGQDALGAVHEGGVSRS